MNMKLNDHEDFKNVDVENYAGLIAQLPDDLAKGYAMEVGDVKVLGELRQVVLAGMGTAKVANEMLQAYVADKCKVPVLVVSDYELPVFANSAETLVVVSAFESDEVCEAWLGKLEEWRCQTVVVCGEELSGVKGVWFANDGVARTTLGVMFGILLKLFVENGLVEDQINAVAETVAEMKKVQARYLPEVPAANNPAKRYAGQLVERWTVLFGVGYLAAVAKRWKNAINLIAKAPASVEVLPDSSYNTYQGVIHTEKVFATNMCLFLREPETESRNVVHEELNRMGMLTEGVNVDFVNAFGKNRLERMWTLVLMGDYVAYYLAMIYEVNPMETELIEELWEDLADE